MFDAYLIVKTAEMWSQVTWLGPELDLSHNFDFWLNELTKDL